MSRESSRSGSSVPTVNSAAGSPGDAGRSADYLQRFAVESGTPTLGVCLGHQVIIEHFGGTVDLAPEPRHGKTSEIRHDGGGVFAGLDQSLVATRYHSLVGHDLPDDLEPTAWAADDDTLQGVRHRDLPVEGVQIHPDSILSDTGKRMLETFLDD